MIMEQSQSQEVVVHKPEQPVQAAPVPTGQTPEKKASARRRTTPTARRKSAKKAEKVVMAKSKRKEAIARASVKAGKGRVRINGVDVDALEQEMYGSLMKEPIGLSSVTKELAGRLDISINVHGGGASSQAQAVRSAIAKGMSKFADTDTIRKEYMRYDKSLLVDDYRRVEPKKYLGPKARAKFQTSYR